MPKSSYFQNPGNRHKTTINVNGCMFAQDDGKSWWLLEPAVIRAGPFMYSGIVHRASNASHVTLGFVFESYRHG